jgi:hypothetical protein
MKFYKDHVVEIWSFILGVLFCIVIPIYLTWKTCAASCPF